MGNCNKKKKSSLLLDDNSEEDKASKYKVDINFDDFVSHK